MDDNSLTALPKAVASWTALKYLSLNNNQISGLIAWMRTCVDFRVFSGVHDHACVKDASSIYLSLSCAYFSCLNRCCFCAELPPQLGTLTALEELYLDNNELIALPTNIGMSTSKEEGKGGRRREGGGEERSGWEMGRERKGGRGREGAHSHYPRFLHLLLIPGRILFVCFCSCNGESFYFC